MMNKKIIHIKNIFTQGKFGEVELGQTIDEVKAILGEPIGVYNNLGDDETYLEFENKSKILFEAHENTKEFTLVGWTFLATNTL